MTSGTEHASAARQHANDGVARMSQVQYNLEDAVRYLTGAQENDIDTAFLHLKQIHEKVGSATADEIANEFLAISIEIAETPIQGIVEVINRLNTIVARTHQAKTRTEQLASVLGG